MLSLCGCPGGKRYRVEYNGSREAFVNAKDSYRAGAQVELKVPLATDTDYSLTVEGVPVRQSASSDYRYIIFSFVMPEHDISVQYSHRNSMMNDRP